MRSLLDPRAGGWGHGGHQTPALPSSLRADGEDRTELLKLPRWWQTAFSISLHRDQRCEGHGGDILSTWTISRLHWQQCPMGKEMLDNAPPRLPPASVCRLQMLGQNSHLYPHLLKTSGIVKRSWSLSLVKPPLFQFRSWACPANLMRGSLGLCLQNTVIVSGSFLVFVLF